MNTQNQTAAIVLQKVKEIQTALKQRDFETTSQLCRNFLRVFNKGEQVIKVAELLVRLQPDDSSAYTYLGVSYFNNEQFRAAEMAYQKAIELNPCNGAAIMNLGNLFYKQGDLITAEQNFSDSVPYIPDANKSVAYLNLANIYTDQKRKDEALAMLGLAKVKSIHDSNLCYMIGNIYFSLEMDKEAIVFYRRAVKANPNCELAYLFLSKLYEKKDMFLQSKKDVRKSYEIVSTRYGDNFKDWPQEKEYHDIYYMYRLYSGDKDTNRRIFKNVNLDVRLSDNGNEIIESFNERQVIVHLKDMNVVGNGWSLFQGKELYFNLSFSINMDMTKGNHVANFFKVDSRSGLSYTRSWDEIVTIDKPVIIMGGAKNYYHWICDYLPRLALLEQSSDNRFKELPILVNRDITSFQKKSLELCGVDLNRLYHIDLDKIYCVKDGYLLHQNNRPLMSHNTPDWMNPAFSSYEAEWLRKTFSPWMSTEKPSKRLFLSRANASFRKCLNEDAVFKVAQQYGFEKVQNENMSFEEQIELYSQAEAVMGVHGAGFTNMVFAPKNSTMIELHAKDELPGFYTNMAKVIGQTHVSVEGILTQALRPMAAGFWNFDVNIDDIKRALDTTFK